MYSKEELQLIKGCDKHVYCRECSIYDKCEHPGDVIKMN